MPTFRDLKIAALFFWAGAVTMAYLIFGQGAVLGSRFEQLGAVLANAATPTYIDTAFVPEPVVPIAVKRGKR